VPNAERYDERHSQATEQNEQIFVFDTPGEESFGFVA
jgi:hypothetical protein